MGSACALFMLLLYLVHFPDKRYFPKYKITKKNRIRQEPERENGSSTRGKCEICQV